MKLTFDTNCLIDLELNEGAHVDLRALIALHDNEKLSVCVPAIGASERLPDGTYAATFHGFKERINRLATRPIELLYPLAYLDITYLDRSILGDDTLVALEKSIHDVLFPDSEFKWKDETDKQGLNVKEALESNDSVWIRWRNRKCDILSMWCHVYYKNDIFISRDMNFHKESKKPRLIEMGARSIAYPSEIESLLRSA